MGTGPLPNEIGGIGIALTIFVFFLTIFFNSIKSIVEVLYQALLGAGGKYEKEAIGKMVMEDGIVKGAEVASKVLATLFTTQEESESPLVQGENQSKETTLSKSTSK